jgi:hypothetical protein
MRPLIALVIILLSGCATESGGRKLWEHASGLASCEPMPSCTEPPPDALIEVKGRVMAETAFVAQPLAFVKVKVLRQDQLVRTVSTDRDGRFTLRDLDHGRYDLVLEADRHQGQAAIDIGFRTLDLVITAKPKAAGAP